MEEYLIHSCLNFNKDSYHLFINNKPKRFYVYALFDEVNNTFFYIGKGINKRAWNHLKLSGKNFKKEAYIANMYSKGSKPKILIIINNLDEKSALYYEKVLISQFKQQLTNIVVSDLQPIEIKNHSPLTYQNIKEGLAEFIKEAIPILKHGLVIENLILYKGKSYNYRKIKNWVENYG